MHRWCFPLTFTLVVGLLVDGKVGAGPLADKNLEAAVRAVLQEPRADLTDEKLNNVFVLEAPGKDIHSLAGLEKCTNLSLLKVSNNQVVGPRPAQGSRRTSSPSTWRATRSPDLTPLAGLARLQYLELSSNQITKIDPLNGLSNLSALYLSGNKVSDLAPLSGLTRLSSLSLAHNQVRDLAPWPR